MLQNLILVNLTNQDLLPFMHVLNRSDCNFNVGLSSQVSTCTTLTSVSPLIGRSTDKVQSGEPHCCRMWEEDPFKIFNPNLSLEFVPTEKTDLYIYYFN